MHMSRSSLHVEGNDTQRPRLVTRYVRAASYSLAEHGPFMCLMLVLFCEMAHGAQLALRGCCRPVIGTEHDH
jgi:hypothetical protein